MRDFIKIIYPDQYGYNDPILSLVDVHSKGIDSAWHEKRAAAGVFKGFEVKPEKGHSFIHLIAMGDSEKYGQNRNGDVFMKSGGRIELPEPKDKSKPYIDIEHGNKTRLWTWEKYAKVYRHHLNKDPKKSEGDVVKAAHNEPMSRVELLVKVPNEKWSKELEKLANGENISVSMATRVPYDYCSYCGNQAASRDNYCDHARNHMTELTKSGHQIGVINDHMTFFDISQVAVNADRIAYGLLKAAGVMQYPTVDECLFFPPQVIDEFPLNKYADVRGQLQKLSDIEKRVPALMKSPIAKSLSSKVSPRIDDADMDKLASASIDDTLGALADRKICLRLPEFVRLVAGEKAAALVDLVKEAEAVLPTIYTKLASDYEHRVPSFALGSNLVPRYVRDVVEKLAQTQSFDDEDVKRRITLAVLRNATVEKSAACNLDAEKVSEPARKIAELYAGYKLAFLQRVGDTQHTDLTALTILHNVISSE